MIHTTNEKEIQDYLKQRLILEQRLAKRLLEEFGKGQFHEDIYWAVWEMLYFLSILEGPAQNIVQQQEKKQSFLKGLSENGGTVSAVLSKLDKMGRLPLPHYADLIRFYGEIVDAASENGTLTWFRQERAKQIGWRYGGGGEYWKALHQQGYRAKADRGSVWQKLDSAQWQRPLTQKQMQIEEHRKALGLEGGRIREKAGDDRVPNPFDDIIPASVFDHPIYKELGVTGKFSGSVVWNQLDDSTVRRIDLAFGLPLGADISGTTTDCMHFMSGFAYLSNKDPLPMMLPLATIVSEYHHSLLEVAAAMSLRKVISYQIGFYESLCPELPANILPHPQRATVKGILSEFDSHPENHHVLIYYDRPKKIGGCFIAEPTDYAAFKDLATCDIRLWPKFNLFNPYPSEKNIMSLLGEHGLQNNALQSRRGSLKKTEHSLW